MEEKIGRILKMQQSAKSSQKWMIIHASLILFNTSL